MIAVAEPSPAKPTRYLDPELSAALRRRRRELGLQSSWVVAYGWASKRVPMTDRTLGSIERGKRTPTIHQMDVLLDALFLSPKRGLGRDLVRMFFRNPLYAELANEPWDVAVASVIPTAARTRLQHGPDAARKMPASIPLLIKVPFTAAEYETVSRALLSRRVRGEPYDFEEIARDELQEAAKARQHVERSDLHVERPIVRKVELALSRAVFRGLVDSLTCSIHDWARDVLLAVLPAVEGEG